MSVFLDAGLRNEELESFEFKILRMIEELDTHVGQSTITIERRHKLEKFELASS